MIPILLLTFSPLASGSLDKGNNTTVGWIPDPNGRGTAGLLWSCLSTLFICLWASLHLNIPGPYDTRSVRFWRKAKWMAITAIVPELVVTLAIGQALDAHLVTKEVQAAGLRSWTRTHSFYANMGGIRVFVPDCPLRGIPAATENSNPKTACPYNFLADAHWVREMVQQGRLPKEISDLTENDISDRSKADGFIKTLACAQALWLFIQCIGRAAQRLPVSTLELSTLAYVFCATTIYAAWWSKPLDVETRTSVQLRCVHVADDGTTAHHATPRGSHHERITASIPERAREPPYLQVRFHNDVQNQSIFPSLAVNLNPRNKLVYSNQGLAGTTALCAIFGAIHCVGWNFSFPTSVERELWRVCSVLSSVSMAASTPVLSWMMSRHVWGSV